MGVWTYLFELAADLNIFGEFFNKPAEKSVSFTIAVVALSAKMAKSDGRVTSDEVRTLRAIFQIDSTEETYVARVFDLARQDIAGYQEYAKKITKLFKDRPQMRADILESLYRIALADGEFHDAERQFLDEVAKIFELPLIIVDEIKAALGIGSCSACDVLGIRSDATPQQIKAAYHKIVKSNHPDVLQARGLPAEAVSLGAARIQAATNAYQTFLDSNEAEASEVVQ